MCIHVLYIHSCHHSKGHLLVHCWIARHPLPDSPPYICTPNYVAKPPQHLPFPCEDCIDRQMLEQERLLKDGRKKRAGHRRDRGGSGGDMGQDGVSSSGGSSKRTASPWHYAQWGMPAPLQSKSSSSIGMSRWTDSPAVTPTLSGARMQTLNHHTSLNLFATDFLAVTPPVSRARIQTPSHHTSLNPLAPDFMPSPPHRTIHQASTTPSSQQQQQLQHAAPRPTAPKTNPRLIHGKKFNVRCLKVGGEHRYKYYEIDGNQPSTSPLMPPGQSFNPVIAPPVQTRQQQQQQQRQPKTETQTRGAVPFEILMPSNLGRERQEADHAVGNSMSNSAEWRMKISSRSRGG